MCIASFLPVTTYYRKLKCFVNCVTWILLQNVCFVNCIFKQCWIVCAWLIAPTVNIIVLCYVNLLPVIVLYLTQWNAGGVVNCCFLPIFWIVSAVNHTLSFLFIDKFDVTNFINMNRFLRNDLLITSKGSNQMLYANAMYRNGEHNECQ